MANDVKTRTEEALRRMYGRASVPRAWARGGNLPWNEPAFADRMLREHLDESHGAASRPSAEREAQIDWLWSTLALDPGQRVYDVTCGPGLYAVELAKRGCRVTGVDFSPASIRYARELATRTGVSALCDFVEADIRDVGPSGPPFDAALVLYGQLAVFPRHQAASIARDVCTRLAPGGQLCIELLDLERVDKKASTWWFTDDTGLWGDGPFLHLGERFWDEDSGISSERFHILHLETGEMDEILLCDQSYSTHEARALLLEAGFSSVDPYAAWDGVALADAREWTVYVAQK